MKKGFTLIELLVLIAIIGILGSVVLNTIKGPEGKTHSGKGITIVDKTYESPPQRDQAIEEGDRRINSCIESISSERERIQERFQKEMSDLDDKVSRQCFNNYSR